MGAPGTEEPWHLNVDISWIGPLTVWGKQIARRAGTCKVIALDKDFKTYVSRCAAYCRDELFLGTYRVDFQWMLKERDGDSADEETYMDITIIENYFEALIRVYPSAYRTWQEGDYKRLGRMVIHEVCHIFLKPMQVEMMADAAPSQVQPYMGIVERTTQHIAIAFARLLPKDWWHPRKFGIDVCKKKAIDAAKKKT